MRLKNFSLCIFLIISLIILTGCGSQEQPQDLKNKVNEEINYLDTKIVSLINSLNGINLQNYKVETQEITAPETSSQSEQNSQSSSQGSEQAGGGESGSSGEQQSQGGESSSKKETAKISEMKTTSILVNTDNKINWDNIKAEIELMYSTWDTIIIDLYKLNIQTEDINSFSSTLNEATMNIKNEDVLNSINTLAKLYSYLPNYLEHISNNTKEVNIKTTKLHVINALAMVKASDWEAVNSEINNAIDSYTLVLNDLEYTKGKEHITNRIYIILTEMNNSLVNQNSDIFYINYKNVMNELNIL